MSGSPRHVFVQVAQARESVWETATLDRGVSKERSLERPWARAPRGLSASAKAAVRKALGLVGLVLFASPVLAAARLLLGGSAPRVADWLAVVFVLLVVVFFALLNLFVLVSVAAWIVRNRIREPYLVAPGAPLPSLVAEDASASSPPGARVLVRGTAVRLEPRGDTGPLVTDVWGRAERRTEADDFAVRRGASAIPVAVRLETAPLLLGAAELREGDEVVVVARVREVATSADRIELGGETRGVPRAPGDDVDDAPYRNAPAGPALVLGDTLAVPVTILVTRKR